MSVECFVAGALTVQPVVAVASILLRAVKAATSGVYIG